MKLNITLLLFLFVPFLFSCEQLNCSYLTCNQMTPEEKLMQDMHNILEDAYGKDAPNVRGRYLRVNKKRF